MGHTLDDFYRDDEWFEGYDTWVPPFIKTVEPKIGGFRTTGYGKESAPITFGPGSVAGKAGVIQSPFGKVTGGFMPGGGPIVIGAGAISAATLAALAAWKLANPGWKKDYFGPPKGKDGPMAPPIAPEYMFDRSSPPEVFPKDLTQLKALGVGRYLLVYYIGSRLMAMMPLGELTMVVVQGMLAGIQKKLSNHTVRIVKDALNVETKFVKLRR